MEQNIVPVLPLSYRDRVRGMLFGVALGDALGAPHEFRHQVPLDRYTGRVEHPLTLTSRYKGRFTGVVGQVTDDTEMMIALAMNIRPYRSAVMSYLEWANSGCPFMGRNTRALFQGVKTLPGYQARMRSIMARPADEWTQSNGCLMRAAPLATMPDDRWREAALADCRLSNPHPVCVNSVIVYLTAARALLSGASAEEASATALLAAEGAVAGAVRAGCAPQLRDIGGDTKGWVVHALYCAFYALNLPMGSFQDRIDAVIRLGGDTDTNAAIAGALLGAQVGEDAMRREDRTGPNLATVLAADNTLGNLPRPPAYSAAMLPFLADNLADRMN